WFHKWCADHCELFKSGQSLRTGRYYRMMNEVPTVLMIAIVVSVIVKF
ncbi:CopD family protein, partial [Rhodobacteraceae bacterium]|nr:CopD family protein [Paracoccaceae bacterium]